MGERNMQTSDDEETIEIPPSAIWPLLMSGSFIFAASGEKLAECSRLNIGVGEVGQLLFLS